MNPNKVTFDTKGRAEYLSGFHDRKVERRARAKVLTEEKIKRFAREKKQLSKPPPEEEDVQVYQEPVLPILDISSIKNYKDNTTQSKVTVKVEPFSLVQEPQDLTLTTRIKPTELTQREKVEILVKREINKKVVTVKRMLPRNTKAKKKRMILHERIKKQAKMKKSKKGKSKK
jgi:hypothetical protein